VGLGGADHGLVALGVEPAGEVAHPGAPVEPVAEPAGLPRRRLGCAAVGQHGVDGPLHGRVEGVDREAHPGREQPVDVEAGELVVGE
jgi:hypothetical protein